VTTVGTDSVGFLLRAIDQRTDAGDSLEAIDADLVRAAPMDEDHRSALWLYAWSRLETPPSHGADRLARISG
jgi:hypothetical protein